MKKVTPNELVNWRRSPAGAQGTNSGHKNAEGMAAVGVHVERAVRPKQGAPQVRLQRGFDCVVIAAIFSHLEF